MMTDWDMPDLDPAKVKTALAGVLAAFPAKPFPRGTPVAWGGRWFDEKGLLHEYADPESNEIERFFGERAWMDIRGAELLSWSHGGVSMSFLTPRALAYYLPAYLTAFLTVPLGPVEFTVLEAAVRKLTPPREGDDAELVRRRGDTRSDAQKHAMAAERVESFRQFLAALTEGQKSAVAAFLEVCLPVFEDPYLENTPQTALDLYWRPRLS
jgi:hypothetical protein